MAKSYESYSQKKKYKVFLKIVGNGPFLSEAKLLCKELDIEDIISFEGVVCDDNIKRNYYLEADVYILPTYHEGFPRTLYEAMIFGTPIITTFVGGISVIMEDNINSLKIEAKSIDSVVEKLEQALDSLHHHHRPQWHDLEE